MGLGIGRVDTSLSRLKANLWKVSVLRGCVVSSGFIIPILVPYLERRAITLSDVCLLEVVFLVSWLVADCPGGLFADRYGRKQAIIAGGFLFLAGGIQYLRADSFADCFVCEILLGFAHACIAGAEQALLRKSVELLHTGAAVGVKEAVYRKHWARAQGLELASAMITSITGAWLYSLDERFPFYAVCAGYVALLVTAFSLTEVTVDPAQRAREKAVTELLRVMRICAGNRRARWSICFFACLFGVFQATLWMHNRYLTSAQIDQSNLGWIGAVMAALSASSALLAGRAERAFGRRLVCFLLVGLCVLGLLGGALFPGWGGVCLLALLQLPRGAGRVLCSSWLEEEVDESVFATAISVQGTVIRLVGIAALLFVASIVGSRSITGCLLWVGGVFGVLSAFMLMMSPHGRRLEQARSPSVERAELTDRAECTQSA